MAATKTEETDFDAIDMDSDEPAALILKAQTETNKSKDEEKDKSTDQKNSKESKESKEDNLKECGDDFCGYFSRPRVISCFYYGDNNSSQLTEFDGSQECGGSVFVEGLSGVGITSTVVSAYLVGQLKLPLVAVFSSPQLPAMCSIHSYKATSPIRIYGNKNICVAVGDYELEPIQQSNLVFNITKAFLDFARRHKCRHIVSIDGYPVKGEMEKKIKSIAKLIPSEKSKIEIKARTSDDSDDEDDEEDEDDDDDEEEFITGNSVRVNGNNDKNGKNGKNNKNGKKKNNNKKSVFETVGYLTNSPEIGIALKKEDHKPIKTGQIIGVTGALLTLSFTAPCDDPPLSVILSPDPVQIPDQRGALLAIKILKHHFGVKEIDTTELKQEAQRLTTKIRSTIEAIKQQVARQYQRNARPPPGMYM